MDKTPDFASEEEAAEFFDTHDTSELAGEDIDWVPSSEPKISYSIRFNRETVGDLREFAEQRGVGVTRLMREWIEQRLAEEKARSGEDHVVALTAHLRAALEDAEYLNKHRPAS